MANSVRISAALDDKVSGPLDKIRGKFDALGNNKGAASILSGVGVGVGLGAYSLLQGAIGSVSDAAFKAIDAASDLNESQSKSKVVFGESAESISKFAKGAATSLGLSEQAALEASAQFGNLFVGLKLGEPAAASMSERMVTLAGDLASFNNIDPTEALLKLRSGLAGESEPLRSLGVFLTEAKIRAEAMFLGLAKGKEPLTEAAKIQARYSLILKETTTAQGDFARTSDGLANTQRILTAEMQNLSAEAGAILLPAVLSLATAFREDILPAIKGVFAEIERGNNEDLFGNLANVIDDLSARTGTAKTFFGTLEEGFLSFADETANFSRDLNDAWTFWDTFTSEAEERVLASTRTNEDILENSVFRHAEIMETGRGPAANASRALAGELPEAVTAAGDRAVESLDKRIDRMVKLLSSRRGALEDAASGIADATWDPQINRAELALTELALKDKDLLAALKDKDATIRAQAQVEYANLQKDLLTQRAAVAADRTQGQAELDAALVTRNRVITNANGTILADAGTTAKATATQLAEQFERGRKRTADAAESHRKAIADPLGQLPASAYGWGSSTALQLAAGLKSQQTAIATQAANAARTLADYLELRSPAKVGPLSEGGPEAWGAKLGYDFSSGLEETVPAVTAAASKIAAAASLAKPAATYKLGMDTLVQALSGRRGAIEGAAGDVADATWDPQINKAKQTLIHMALQNEELLANLKSTNDITRLQAEIEYANLMKDKERIRGAVKSDNQLGQAELEVALRQRRQTIKDSVGDKLADAAHDWGASFTRKYANGLKSEADYLEKAAAKLAKAVAAYLKVSSPAEKGPLSVGGPEAWGAKVGALFGAGMQKATNAVAGGASSLAAAAMPTLGEPAYAGTGASLGGGMSGGGNVTVQVNFTSIATPSPSDGQRIAAAIGPELQRWMRTNQLTAA